MIRIAQLLSALACGVVLCSATPRPPTDALLGKWYQGDGLGYNIDLTLKPDSSYTAVWTGCLGTYGTARGHWHVEGTRITLAPTEETDAMRNHLRVLHVIREKKLIVLVQPRHLSSYKEYGLKPHFWCFTRDE